MDIIKTQFGEVVLTGGSDVRYTDSDPREITKERYVGKKAKRVSDGMRCLCLLSEKPKDYKYDVVFN